MLLISFLEGKNLYDVGKEVYRTDTAQQSQHTGRRSILFVGYQQVRWRNRWTVTGNRLI